ncbi:MAG: methyl-accepting chemotaxis protein [Phycisphaerales bacterium]
MRASLRTQLILLGSLSFVLSGVIGFVTWRGMHSVTQTIEHVSERTVLLRASAEGDMMHDAIRSDILSWMLADDDAGKLHAKSDLESHIENFQSLLGKVSDAKLSDEQRKSIDSAVEAVNDYIASSRHLVGLSHDDSAEIASSKADFDAKFSALESELEAMSGLIEDDATKAAQSASAAPAELLKVLIITLAVGGLVVSALVWFVIRSILRRTTDIRNSLSSIERGDLTQALNVTQKDELGQIAASVEQTRKNLASLLKSIQQSSEEVRAAATKMDEVSGTLNVELKRQETESAQVAAAVEEMSASIQEVSQGGLNAAKAASDSREAAQKGSSVVGQTVDEIQGIAQGVKQSADAVSTLGKTSEQIGEIIKVINDIADQTNLLALNAAIEAARAGEHGRGFAVVADEVRKLAERTTKATEEVAGSIREIQSQTTQAVSLMNSGSQRVAKGVELAGQAGAALQTINQGSSSVAGMVQSIAAATEEQSAAAVQVSESLQKIQQITRNSLERAGHVVETSHQLSSQSDALSRQVKEFRF